MSLYAKLKDGYQKRVVDNNLKLIQEVISGEKKGIGRQVTTSPTGSGKTFMMAATIEAGLSLPERPSFVWLTHNRQLLSQTENEIKEELKAYLTPVFNIEHNIGGFGGRVLLFNVQKGVSNKAKSWLKKWYSYQRETNAQVVFIVDEADEGMSGSNMGNLQKVLQPCLELGFTASFKKKDDEFEFQKVTYKEVIEAEMLVNQIYWQASDEVTPIEMMRRAISQRDFLEKQARFLRLQQRYFVPKMLIQTKASESEEVARELNSELGLSEEEFNKQVVVHIQNSRGLDEVEDMSEVRYIIGDMMIERGWNCPEAYVLLSLKDSVSQAKGIQLLGRVIRLPMCELFDDSVDVFNYGYIYISGKHSIEQSAKNFGNTDIALPPPKEVDTVEKRDLVIPEMITFLNQLLLEIESEELIPTTDKIVGVIELIRKECVEKNPIVTSGELNIGESSHSISPVEEVETDWNLLQTKKMLIDSLCRHLPRDYATLVIVKYQTSLIQSGGLGSISKYAKMIAEKLKDTALIKKITEKLVFRSSVYDWPKHKLVISKPLPLRCERSLYPKIQVNDEEKKFTLFLDEVCSELDCYWVRNDPSDIKLFKGHAPDFIVFSKDKYIFIEYKGKHLLRTSDSITKNYVGQKSANYYMVYFEENKMMLKNLEGLSDEEFKIDHIRICLT